MKRLIQGLIPWLLMLSVLLGAVSSCAPQSTAPSGQTGSTANGGTTHNGTAGESGTTGGGFTVAADILGEDQQADFEALFDYGSHISLKLDIPEGELAKLQKDHERYSSFGSKSPIFRKANLYITVTRADGEVIERVIGEVGVRMKGNTSRTDFYSEEEGMYNLIHFKLSFDETFDRVEYYGADANTWESEAERNARKNRTFATLEKMDVRWNRNDDTTYIREIYAYDLYREVGLLAPHANLASVDIGDDHGGVFVIYEPIDKIFLEKNLPKSAQGGDLYKLGWTNEGATFTAFRSVGQEDEDRGQFFVYDSKTNKNTTDHSALRRLIDTLNSPSLSKKKFAEVVDADAFLTFAAVSYMIGNPDDLRSNYNNCYLYFMADTGLAQLIPYDLDRGLGVNTWNPYGDGMTTQSPFDKYSVQGDQKNPLFTKSVVTGGFYVSEFAETLKEVSAHRLFAPETFAQRFLQAQRLYMGETAPSKVYKNAKRYAFTFDLDKTASPSDSANMSFADYIAKKQNTLKKALESDISQESGQTWELYLRGNFSNWQNSEAYKMTAAEDGYTVTLTQNSEIKCKVYDNKSGKWYGAEAVAEECEVEYGTDGHTNIVLPAGTYTLRFFTETQTVMITKVS